MPVKEAQSAVVDDWEPAAGSVTASYFLTNSTFSFNDTSVPLPAVISASSL